MTLIVAIVADDLTGALDSAAPFAERGLRTVAALEPAALDEALSSGAGVVAVNTLSRHLPSDAAAAIAAQVTRRCIAAGARILFKKIDSRMRGQVGAEAVAVARASAATTLIVAPAVPTQGRFVVEGRMKGAGIADEAGIDIHASLEMAIAAGLMVQVPDSRTEADLDAIAVNYLASAADTIAVGAHGLAAALARSLVAVNPINVTFVPELPALVAVGSQDPATAAQIQMLAEGSGLATLVEAPEGLLGPATLGPSSPVTILRSVAGAMEGNCAVERFAAGAAAWWRASRPRTLLVTGGDTAAAILQVLDCHVLEVGGQAAPGIPWSRLPGGAAILTKSGGFGHGAVLLELFRQ